MKEIERERERDREKERVWMREKKTFCEEILIK